MPSRTLTVLASLLLFASLAVPAAAQHAQHQDVEINEWTVPWEDTRPRDPYVGPDGLVYFVGQRADYIGRLDPATGEFKRWMLDDGAGPHNLIVAEDGTIWYAGNRARHIGALDPATGEIEKYVMPDERARDPHTLVWDGKGGMWFTVQGGNFIGHFDPATGKVRLVDVPTDRARPYGIVVDDDGRPWFTLFGTNKLGTVDPETMELTEIELDRPDARPRRLARTSDGDIWYVDYAQGYLGQFDPDSWTVVNEWRTPSAAGARPYGMAVDDRDRLWFVETGIEPNQFVGFDPATGSFISVEAVPSGGGTVRHMFYDAERGAVWFGADTNTIGRAIVRPERATSTN